MITGENFIGYQRSSMGSVKFKTINPTINLENDWEMTEACQEEISTATTLAWTAFKVFRKTNDQERADFLDAIADEIEALGDDLLQIYMTESGLPEPRAKVERGRTIFQLRTFAEFIRKGDWKETTFDAANPDRSPNPKPDLRKTMIPLGPVVVFGSSNFPLAYSTAGGDTASAFAAGCPVIVKSHPMHAGTGELVAEAIVKAAQKTGMPEGVFSNLNGNGYEVANQLVQDPKVKAVGFTGSIAGGRAIYDLASKRNEPIPVFAEMGSINPVVISNNSLANSGNKWAEIYANSITLGNGQFCTNPGLLLGIDGPDLEQFAMKLAEEIAKKLPQVMLHPNIKSAYSRLKSEVTKQEGVQILTKNIAIEENLADPAIATVSGKSFLDNPALHKEVFGPFSIIVKCKDQTELISVIEQLEGQLTGTLIVEENELNEFKKVADELQYRVGRIIYNGIPTGVEVSPAMNHGGPYPASTDSRFTAVGTHSIRRWIRPISFQNFPKELLPNELKNAK